MGVIGVAVLAVLLGFLGPYVYIHFIEGPAPARLELPGSSVSTTSTPAQGSDTTSSSPEGTWNVGSGSTAGYRVREVLIGRSATAVGRTNKIWGSLTVAGSTVTKGTFTVNMATVVSDQIQRNARFADHGCAPTPHNNADPHFAHQPRDDHDGRRRDEVQRRR